MKRSESIVLRAAATAAAFLVAGVLACGSEDPGETAAPAPAAEEVDVEEVVVDERGIVWGETEMPADFPEDLPLLDGAVVTSALAAAEAGTAVNLTSDKPVAEVYAFYEQALPEAGWKLGPSREVAGHKVITATRENLTLVVSAASVEGQSRVALSIATN